MKSIIGITNLIYFRDILKNSFVKFFVKFKCLEHDVVFPVDFF